MKIAFFGTGLLGYPMAERLLENGHQLRVFNRTKSKAEPLRSFGAVLAGSPSEAVEECNVIIVMLSDYNAIQEVFIQNNLDLSGKHLIQMSTIAPVESIELMNIVKNRKGEYFEAPVLGSIPQVKSGNLITLIGSTKEQFADWHSFFTLFGDKVFYAGEAGKAAALKLALNQLIASLTSSFAMSLGYVRESGLNVEQFMDILRGSALYAPTFDKKLDKYLSGNYSNPNFPLKHLLKDAKLIKESFEDKRINTAQLNGLIEILEEGVGRDLSDSDYSALYKIIHPGDR